MARPATTATGTNGRSTRTCQHRRRNHWQQRGFCGHSSTTLSEQHDQPVATAAADRHRTRGRRKRLTTAHSDAGHHSEPLPPQDDRRAANSLCARVNCKACSNKCRGALCCWRIAGCKTFRYVINTYTKLHYLQILYFGVFTEGTAQQQQTAGQQPSMVGPVGGPGPQAAAAGAAQGLGTAPPSMVGMTPAITVTSEIQTGSQSGGTGPAAEGTTPSSVLPGGTNTSGTAAPSMAGVSQQPTAVSQLLAVPGAPGAPAQTGRFRRTTGNTQESNELFPVKDLIDMMRHTFLNFQRALVCSPDCIVLFQRVSVLYTNYCIQMRALFVYSRKYWSVDAYL